MNRPLRDFSILVSGMASLTLLSHILMLRLCPDPGFYRLIFLFPLCVGVACAWNPLSAITVGFMTLVFVVEYVPDVWVGALVTTAGLSFATTTVMSYPHGLGGETSRYFLAAQMALFLIVSLANDIVFSIVTASLVLLARIVLCVPVYAEKPVKTFPPSS